MTPVIVISKFQFLSPHLEQSQGPRKSSDFFLRLQLHASFGPLHRIFESWHSLFTWFFLKNQFTTHRWYPYIVIFQKRTNRNWWCWRKKHVPFHIVNHSGQIIATSHDLTPKCSYERDIPLFQDFLGWWNIVIWPDHSIKLKVIYLRQPRSLVLQLWTSSVGCLRTAGDEKSTGNGFQTSVFQSLPWLKKTTPLVN